jgi:hypothetical protein
MEAVAANASCERLYVPLGVVVVNVGRIQGLPMSTSACLILEDAGTGTTPPARLERW